MVIIQVEKLHLRKRVLVVAEAPVDTLVSYGIQTDDLNMPSELQKN